MTNPNISGFFRLSGMTALLASAFSSANAQQVDAERLAAIANVASISSEVRLGVGLVSDDNRRFGQYSGMRDEGAYALADINFRTLDKESGTWLKFYGRNLGLDSREFYVDRYQQGGSRYLLGYSQIVRYEPMVVTTGLTGIGSTRQTVNGSALRPVDLQMKRDLLSLGFDSSLGGVNAVRVRYTHEDKEGARLFGRGATASGSPTPTQIEFLTEPIHRNTQTLELSMSHAGKTLQLSGGYYGTLFLNYAQRLDVSDSSGGPLNTLTNGIPAFSPMSMPLSNDSHQLFLTGGYSFTPLTRLGFKTSYTVARQNENLMAVPVDILNGVTVPPSGAASSLNGMVLTKLAYLDLTSMEFDRLDLQANVRYESRDDKTPEAQYLTPVAQSSTLAGFNGNNKPRDWRSMKTKLEAGYQLPLSFKMVGGWELDQQRRNSPEPYRRVGFREETDETTGRVELKRMIAESATGTIAYLRAIRRGSEYMTNTYNPASNKVNPLIWADRDRDTFRATIDWAPLDDLSIHIALDQSDDEYNGRPLGPRDGGRSYYSIDASYAISSRWQATLFLSRDDTKARQRTQTGAAQQWEANMRQLGDAVGVGVRGKLRSGIELGGDLNHFREAAENRMASLSSNFQVTSLPDYHYEMTELKLFGNYPINESSGVRVDYAFQQWKTNDWTWNGWAYSDGTTVAESGSQHTHYLGASYNYRWR